MHTKQFHEESRSQFHSKSVTFYIDVDIEDTSEFNDTVSCRDSSNWTVETLQGNFTTSYLTVRGIFVGHIGLGNPVKFA